MTEKIILPTGKEALVVRLANPSELTPEKLRRSGIAEIERYICACVEQDGVKAFEMLTKQEIDNKELLEELRSQFKFQIAVLKQL